jgi:hypothetical protein
MTTVQTPSVEQLADEREGLPIVVIASDRPGWRDQISSCRGSNLC